MDKSLLEYSPMVKTIDEALDVIYSLVDYSKTHVEDTSKDVFTLETIRKLAANLGDPQKEYPIIHVAGTKGKGSVCAMLAAALQNAGFKTGLYTSPHLICFNERIMINGKMISDEEIIEITNTVLSAIGQEDHVSSFEFMTAMAFEYFKKHNVDIAVIETGLGGRLDATNIVDPVLSIITSISLDHISYLGETIEKIAAEKAGIIKKNVPVICGVQPYPEALEIIKTRAAAMDSPWIDVTKRYRFINQRNGNAPDSLLIWRVEDMKLFENWCRSGQNCIQTGAEIALPLAGMHQLENAAAVYAALNKLKSKFNHFDLSKACQGIGKTFWPCRFELLCREKPLIADGAHNIDSIRKLGTVLERYYGTKEIVCIFGASEDKALQEMLLSLAPHVDRFIMTRAEHPRAADPNLLSDLACAIGRKNQITNTLKEAYAFYENETNSNACYIATGSLFVAGGIREIYMENNKSIRYFEQSI